MRTCAALLLCACFAGCGNSKPGAPQNPDGGQIFDPCVPNPQSGYDPVAAGLPACCTDTGPAHCVPNDQVLPALAAQLMACDASSVCMPDPIVRGGGAYVPPSCTSSVGNAAGVCLSKCIPLVANNSQSALLGQDGCGDGELCVPCLNPVDHSDTGACEINAKLCGTDDGGTGADGGTAICPYTGPPIIDPSTLPDCSPACGGAHCLPKSAVPTAQQGLLDACTAAGGAPGLCAPDPLIASGGNFVPKTCTSVAGAEGRCLSVCLPSVAAEASLLPTDVCAAGEKCAPCYNPTASDPTAPTGACSIACDKPTKPPVVLNCPWTGPAIVDPSAFPACSPACGGAHCVPKSMVPAAQQSLLASCDNGNGLCAPDPIVAADGNFVPKTCTSVAGAEGRCLSTCLPEIAAEASLLPTDVCASGEKCAPCYNPTAADPTAPTGACSLACDKPTKPPVILSCPWTGPNLIDPSTFPACSPACGGAHCVPSSMVPPSEQGLLAACPGGFCAPDPIIATDNHWVPKACTSIAGAEGRCLSTCLPDIAAQAAVLPTGVCAAGEKCAPCYNPTAADPTVPTGACSIACDKPTQPPVVLSCPWTGPAVIDPSMLPACSPACTGAHCLPGQYIPPAEQSLLAACTGGFCTPDPMISTAGNYKPPTCVSFAGVPQSEGRCLSDCLPSVSSQPSLEQSSCTSGNKCAPCYNPISGASTGACNTSSCDAPAAAPYVFPNCCMYQGTAQGRCVPKTQIPSSEQGNLNQDICSSSVYLCVPDVNLPGSGVTGQGCKASLLLVPYNGSCISDCVNLGLGAIYPQGNCPGNYTCIPCSQAPAGSPGC